MAFINMFSHYIALSLISLKNKLSLSELYVNMGYYTI